MPYMTVGKCVYKKKADGSKGKKVGCTEGSVKKYLAALHMHADESMKITKEQLKHIIKEELKTFLNEKEKKRRKREKKK